jgi:hypothetical protein
MNVICSLGQPWSWPTMVTYEQELVNMVNHCQPWSTTVNHGHGQPSSTIVKVIHSEIDLHAYMKIRLHKLNTQ